MSEVLDVRVVQLDLKARDLTCAFSPDRTRAVTGVVGKVVRLWDVEIGHCLQLFEGHTDTVRNVEWSADQRYVLSASHDRTVRIWEVETGQWVRVLAGHAHLVVNAAWCPDQRHVVSCDEGACLRIWDLKEKE